MAYIVPFSCVMYVTDLPKSFPFRAITKQKLHHYCTWRNKFYVKVINIFMHRCLSKRAHIQENKSFMYLKTFNAQYRLHIGM